MAFAGMASICAATVTQPIDLMKVRLQLEGEATKAEARQRQYGNIFRGIYMVAKHEGVLGLYKGVTASWARESVYSTLRLGLYEPFKRALGATDPEKTPFWLKFIAAGMSGFVGSALSNPMDLMKVRMQAYEGPPKTATQHINEIYQTSGLKGFYIGVVPTILRAMMLNATKLSTYDHIKHYFINSGLIPDGKANHFASSIVAGVCIAIVTSPIDVVKTRIMN